MNKHRVNFDFPDEDFTYLKMVCAKKKLSLKDYLTPIIQKALDDEADVFLAEKAAQRLKDLNQDDLISFDDACKLAGWDV